MDILIFSFWLQILIKCSSIYRFEKLEGRPFSISDSDYFVFHSPYNKVIVMQELFLHLWNVNKEAEKYVITRPTMSLFITTFLVYCSLCRKVLVDYTSMTSWEILGLCIFCFIHILYSIQGSRQRQRMLLTLLTG